MMSTTDTRNHTAKRAAAVATRSGDTKKPASTKTSNKYIQPTFISQLVVAITIHLRCLKTTAKPPQ